MKVDIYLVLSAVVVAVVVAAAAAAVVAAVTAAAAAAVLAVAMGLSLERCPWGLYKCKKKH